jgi:hypothetical protein
MCSCDGCCWHTTKTVCSTATPAMHTHRGISLRGKASATGFQCDTLNVSHSIFLVSRMPVCAGRLCTASKPMSARNVASLLIR